MRTFAQSDPLTDAELDRLGDFLKGCKGGRAMNVEQLDGFFAALIAGPETVMPSEYYPEVFGGEMADTCEFGSVQEANEILGLMMRGMSIRHDGWARLMDDEEHGGWLIPVMMLYHEHDEDPEMRPKPISTEQREDVIVHMAAGLLKAYGYFRAQREADRSVRPPESRREVPKVGRNDPCPCGSGKKYKRCCGGATVN